MNLKVCTRAGFASGLQTVQVSYILLNNDYSSGTISAVGRAFDSMLEVLGSIPGSVKGVLVTYFLPHAVSFTPFLSFNWPGRGLQHGTDGPQRRGLLSNNKTNNQASFGGSLLQNNMEVEAAIELARHLDETGLHRVRTGFDQTWSGSVGLYHSNRPV